MLRVFVRIALRILRIAGETFFVFELNRFLGRAVRGPVRHRRRALPSAVALLLRHVRAPVHTLPIRLPSGLHIHTILAGPVAKHARARAAATTPPTRTAAHASQTASTSAAQTDADADAATDIVGAGASAQRFGTPGCNPVVLLHGHSMGGATFFRNVDDLLDMGFTNVYIPDLPGWGLSSRPPFRGSPSRRRRRRPTTARSRCPTPSPSPRRRTSRPSMSTPSQRDQYAHHQQSQKFHDDNFECRCCSQCNDEHTTKSEHTVVDHAAVDYFLAPLMAWIQALGLSSFTLIGHSLGAYVAHEFARRAPPHTVSHLILTAPAAISRRTPLSQALWFALTPQRFLTHGGLLANLFFASKYPSIPAYNASGFRDFTFLSNSIAAASGDAAAASMLRIWRSGLFHMRSEVVRPLIECVCRLPCAVHLIAGERDDLVPVAAVRALYNALRERGNRVALTVVSAADHSPHIVAPFAFAKAIMRVESAMQTVVMDGEVESAPVRSKYECFHTSENGDKATAAASVSKNVL